MDKGLKFDNTEQKKCNNFNYARNREKAIFGLKGILEGIVGDQKLMQEEVLFLKTWLCCQDNLCENSDLIDLLYQIAYKTGKGHTLQEELNESKELIADIINSKKLEHVLCEAEINELDCFLSGVVADKVINDKCLLTLNNWLESNSSICTTFPTNIIAKRVEQIINDKLITKMEKDSIHETLNLICGNRFEESGLAYGMTTEFFEDPVNLFYNKGQVICFSGQFITGSIRQVQDIALEGGATLEDKVSSKSSALIIGTFATRDWYFTSHGSNIKRARELKLKGKDLLIITEQSWLKCLENA